MTRIHNITSALSIWVFPKDHAPPHFHIMHSDKTDVSVDLRTLKVMCGQYDRRHLADGLAWAAVPENFAILVAEWSRLNEQG